MPCATWKEAEFVFRSFLSAPNLLDFPVQFTYKGTTAVAHGIACQ